MVSFSCKDSLMAANAAQLSSSAARSLVSKASVDGRTLTAVSERRVGSGLEDGRWKMEDVSREMLLLCDLKGC